MANIIRIAILGILLSGCATKNFKELPTLDEPNINDMTCEEIKKEFFKLSQYEDFVDEEATQGQAAQIFWGGLWSVMADEKLEDIARKDIRKRTRLLYELKIDKGCS